MDESRSSSPLAAITSWLQNTFSPRPESWKEVIEEAIEEHAENGEAPLDPQERALLQNVLDFSECTVAEIMIPRTDIVAVSHTITLPELKAHIIEQRHTRTPVYEETLDHISGFLHVKDLLPMIAGDKPFNIRTYLRTMIYVPPSMKVTALLAKMRAAGTHMAIVVDEHGGTDGLVTMEDVIEEVFGDIHDEHDEDEIKNENIVRINEKTFEANARVRIEELSYALGKVLATEEELQEFDTLAGLISTRLGRVPNVGEIVPHESGVKFEIMEADPRRIKKVRIHLA